MRKQCAKFFVIINIRVTRAAEKTAVSLASLARRHRRACVLLRLRVWGPYVILALVQRAATPVIEARAQSVLVYERCVVRVLACVAQRAVLLVALALRQACALVLALACAQVSLAQARVAPTLAQGALAGTQGCALVHALLAPRSCCVPLACAQAVAIRCVLT